MAACFGSVILGVLDPFSLLVRSIGLALLPAFNVAVRAVLSPMEHSHIAVIRSTGGALHTVLQALILDFRQAHFTQSVVLGILFLIILAASLRVTRLWCRAICPLGALLGACSRFSILGLHKEDSACNRCNRCLLHCQGGDDPVGGVPWHKSECHLCMNCVAACPDHALSFRFLRPAFDRSREVSSPDLTRRKTMTGLAAGIAAVPLMRANVGLGKGRHDRLLRPPGALEEADFLSRCIRCGECMKVCPNNAIQPTLTEAGLEGLWTPTLVPRIGYCEPSCVLCSEVCPTGAIWQITPREKGWVVGVSAESAHPHRDCVLRSRPLPALGRGHRVHCVRGVVPGFSQGHLRGRSRRGGFRWRSKATEAAASGSQPVRWLRRVRIRVPIAGSPGRVRHQHWRKSLALEPDSAQPELTKETHR